MLLLLPMASFAQTVNVLVVAIHGVETGKREWQPTIDYLQQTFPQYDFKLVPVTPIDLPRIKKLIGHQEIDFVISQPAIYVDLELNFGISRILTMVKKGGFSQFGSTIIARADSRILSINDLHGRTIAGVAKLGFGGWLVGYNEMLKNGFDPYEDARDVMFLGTQPKEIQAVLEYKADAAIIRTGVLEKLSNEGKIDIDDFRILAPKTHPNFPFKISTPLYPEWVFAKTHKASDDLSRSVALALLSLEKNSPAAKRARFQEWTFPYDYQPVHNLLKNLHVGPYKDYGKINTIDFMIQHKIEIIVVLILVMGILLMTVAVYRSNINLAKEKLEKEKALESMKHLATHDSLTNLPNRLLFIEHLEKLIYDAQRRGTTIAVLFMDLDGFKNINDRLGHSMGDKVLCQASKMLLESSRVNDIAGRLGGDEFIIAFNDIKEIDDLKTLASRILERISNIDLPNVTDISVGVSIGVIYGNPGQNSAEHLIHLSDELMYEAKQAGKGRFVLKPIPPSGVKGAS